MDAQFRSFGSSALECDTIKTYHLMVSILRRGVAFIRNVCYLSICQYTLEYITSEIHSQFIINCYVSAFLLAHYQRDPFSIERVRENRNLSNASTLTTVDELKRKALVNMLAPVVCCSGNVQLFFINVRTVYDCLCFVC